jgi:hypothetical protein
LCVIENEFVPVLSNEHCGWAWATIEQAPKPLHQGLRTSFANKIIRTKLQTIFTSNAKVFEYEGIEGDIFHIAPLHPHQVICIEAGTILEVSTPDSVEDNYRISPGDSQSEDNS